VLLAVLPAIYALLTSRFGFSVAVKDLFVTRASLIFNVFGALLIAVSPAPSFLIISVTVYSFGYGFSAAVRSLLTSLVRPDQISRMYAILSILDTIGNLVSGPVLSGAYSWGLHRGGLWSGSVFGIVALLFAVVCLPIFLFKLPVVEVDED
jgi:MFS family permease